MAEIYCVCQQPDGGFMLECSRGTGGCNGWVHPDCCGLKLPVHLLEQIESYVCPLCEVPEDSAPGATAITTKKANDLGLERSSPDADGHVPGNEMAKRKRVNSTESSEKDLRPATKKVRMMDDSSRLPVVDENMWTCSLCKSPNSEQQSRCDECGERRPDTSIKKSSKDRHSKKKKKHKSRSRESDAAGGDVRRSNRGKIPVSYHVPESDDSAIDPSSSDDVEEPLVKPKKRKMRPANESSHKEADVSWSAGALVPSSLVIEKLLGKRQNEAADGIVEYFVKWKGWSYIHASWETENTLLGLDPQNKVKIRRFLEKDGLRFTNEDEELFNPDYCEVHRILAKTRAVLKSTSSEAQESDTVDDGIRYFVKWQNCSYAECTWERACDVSDDAAIALFKKREQRPPPEECKPPEDVVLRDYRKLDQSPNYGDDGSLSLRGYQLEGMNWLMWNFYNHRASILADEMGLGKTIQTVTFLNSLWKTPTLLIRGPFLVVAPLSLITQWQQECETWTELNCVVYHGNSEAREVIHEFEFYYRTQEGKIDRKGPHKFQVLVTTYEIAIKEIRTLSKIHWRCLVVDEAHRLKNQSSRLTEHLRQLTRDHCILLTGTPLQNNTEELWALLNFIDGTGFPKLSSFLEKFGDLQDATQVAELHKLLKPYLLRRVKEDVEKSLPPKEETIIEVELTPVQKQWYRAIYERNTAFLFRGATTVNAPSLMNVVMELRKCCNHPYLNNGAEEVLTTGLRSIHDFHEMMVKCSGKLVLLDKLLPRLKRDGHKVLIFSQMVRVLDILEDYLRYLNYGYERLDGNIRGNLRQAAIDRFVKPQYDRFVMLLSTKAGGLGLNLTAADTVIIFDSDWNPQNDLQAQARAHRIGQTHAVKIYRLVTRKTYEMHMFHRASLKLGLDQAVLTHMRNENERAAISDASEIEKKKSKAKEAQEIDELLKRGAYDVFREDDTASEQFCAADIEQILERSTQIIQYEQKARSTFSKASFVSATTSEELDIDDPDFWNKAIGLQTAEPQAEDNELLVPAQRKRTRVHRYGEVPSDVEVEEDDIEDEEDDVQGKKKKEKENESSKDWTVNARDRFQRALLQFGYGRWDVIRPQCGGTRSIASVEAFARAFLLQCGLHADGGPGSKEDPLFIRDAITAARAMEPAYKNGLLKLPPILSEEDFVSRLRQGSAKRVFNRLEILTRLQKLVAKSCQIAEGKRPYTSSNPSQSAEDIKIDKVGDGHKSLDVDTRDGGCNLELQSSTEEISEGVLRSNPRSLDERVKTITLAELSSSIPLENLGDRPSWAKLKPWWDDICDRHILIGVFRHGYGRYSSIAADKDLCFFNKLEEAHKAAEINEKSSTVSLSEPGVQSELPEGISAVSEESTIPKDSDEAVDDTKLQEAIIKRMPEVPQMNKLLSWLLSGEDISRRREDELTQREHALILQQRNPQIVRQHQDASERFSVEKASSDPLIRLAQEELRLREKELFHHRIDEIPLHLLVPDNWNMAGVDWTLDERRLLCYVLTAHGAPKDEDVEPTDAKSKREVLYWCDISKKAALRKSALDTLKYFKERFLPHCLALAVRTRDPTSNNLNNAPNMDFVDPDVPVEQHSKRACQLAALCIRRIRIFRAASYIMDERKADFERYLKSADGRRVTLMPLWWCPWVHDLALMKGVVKFGVTTLKAMRNDSSSPLSREAINLHIRKVFLVGTKTLKPVANHIFYDGAQLKLWLDRVQESFPSRDILEDRISWHCQYMTRSLPQVHFARVEVDTYMNAAESRNSVLSTHSIDAAMSPSTRKEANKEELRRLQEFLDSSRNRRLQFLKDRHTLQT